MVDVSEDSFHVEDKNVPRCNGLWGRTGHGKQDWLTISENIASGELAFDNISPKTRLFTVLSMVWNPFGKLCG